MSLPTHNSQFSIPMALRTHILWFLGPKIKKGFWAVLSWRELFTPGISDPCPAEAELFGEGAAISMPMSLQELYVLKPWSPAYELM